MLTVDSIYKTYEGQPLLQGLSLQVAQGETLCLLGPSGSGKSTLLRIIAGLEEAESGKISWDGKDITSIPAYQRHFGLMFQDYALFPHRDVTGNVAFGLRMAGLPSSEIALRVREALEQVDMLPFAQRKVGDLSGGEQQRVALARSLAPRPRLLMLDEPLGALDYTLRTQLVEELKQLLQSSGIPAIYVTHDQEEAFVIADRLALLNNGRIEQEGSPPDVMACPSSLWAARFLGLTNLVEAAIISLDPFRVRSPLGEWELAIRPPCSGMAAIGQSLTLLVRPFGAHSEPQAGDIAIEGTVLQSMFRGEHYRLVLETVPGIRLHLDIREPGEVGRTITLYLSPDEVVALPAT